MYLYPQITTLENSIKQKNSQAKKKNLLLSNQ